MCKGGSNLQIYPKRPRYDQIEEHLESQYDVKNAIIGASVKFITRKQHAGESIEMYAQCLNELASHCDYHPNFLDRILRHFCQWFKFGKTHQ